MKKASFLIVFLILSLAFPLFIFEVYAPTEIRYMRGDQATVNGLLAYILGLSQTEISRYSAASKTASTAYVVYCGIRVWKRDSGGTETEITSGEPVAVVSRSTNGEGIQSAAWDCPQTSLSATDTIVVRVYLKVNVDPWTQGSGAPNFQTEQLSAQSLDAATWTVYYYTKRSTITKPSATTQITFYWGTSTYNSRVENFVWTEAEAPPEEYSFEFSNTIGISANSQFSRALMVTHTETTTITTTITKWGAYSVSQQEFVEVSAQPYRWSEYSFFLTSIVNVPAQPQLWRALTFTSTETILSLAQLQRWRELMFTSSQTANTQATSEILRALMLGFPNTVTPTLQSRILRELLLTNTENTFITALQQIWKELLFLETEITQTETVHPSTTMSIFRELKWFIPITTFIQGMLHYLGRETTWSSIEIVSPTTQIERLRSLFSAFTNTIPTTLQSIFWKEIKVVEAEYFEIVSPHSQTYWITELITPAINLALILAAFAFVMSTVGLGTSINKKEGKQIPLVAFIIAIGALALTQISLPANTALAFAAFASVMAIIAITISLTRKNKYGKFSITN